MEASDEREREREIREMVVQVATSLTRQAREGGKAHQIYDRARELKIEMWQTSSAVRDSHRFRCGLLFGLLLLRLDGSTLFAASPL